MDEVASGEEIIIARAGKPVAKLVPLQASPAARQRTLGILAGRFKVPADVDKPLTDDELGDFEGR